MIARFTLRNGYKVTAFAMPDRAVMFETENEDGEVISVVTHKRPEANRLLTSLSLVGQVDLAA